MQIQFHSVWKNWNDKFKQKKFEIDLVIKLCGKILYPTESVKYLSGCENCSCWWSLNCTD